MLDTLIMFGAMFFGGLVICGGLGYVVDKLSKCKWVGRMVGRMMHE